MVPGTLEGGTWNPGRGYLEGGKGYLEGGGHLDVLKEIGCVSTVHAIEIRVGRVFEN